MATLNDVIISYAILSILFQLIILKCALKNERMKTPTSQVTFRNMHIDAGEMCGYCLARATIQLMVANIISTIAMVSSVPNSQRGHSLS